MELISVTNTESNAVNDQFLKDLVRTVSVQIVSALKQ